MKPSFKHSLMIVLALLALTFGALRVTPADAATIAVTNANDSGAGSLRQAIADAAAGDTITFDGDYTIPLASTLNIAKNLTIDGAGHIVTISGDVNNDATGETRIFYVNTGATFTLQNLTVTKGLSGTNGGGLTNNYGATTTVNNVTFSDNHALVRGGGIQNYGTLAVTNGTFSGNIANDYGGAILINSGTVTVTNSTFFDNHAGGGGGIFTFGVLNLVNDTFAGNTGSGGALRNSGGSISSVNSIFVKEATGNNCSGAIASGNNNLADDTTCGTPVTNSSTILLGTLGDYGGTTQTIPLLSGSSAIDAGDPSACPETDQRGFSRAGTCDIGAYAVRKIGG